MPGFRTHENGTYVTKVTRYRSQVAEADADFDAIPEINTNADPESLPQTLSQGSMRGFDSVIFLYFLLRGCINHVRYRVWINGTVPTQPDEWCVVEEGTIYDRSSFVAVRRVPPARYKVEIVEMDCGSSSSSEVPSSSQSPSSSSQNPSSSSSEEPSSSQSPSSSSSEVPVSYIDINEHHAF